MPEVASVAPETEPRRSRPRKVIANTKLPKALYDRLRDAAQQHDRTVSGQLRAIVKAWAEQGNA